MAIASPATDTAEAFGDLTTPYRRPRIDLARVPHGAPGPVATPARGAAPARRPGLARERGGGPARALRAGREQRAASGATGARRFLRPAGGRARPRARPAAHPAR